MRKIFVAILAIIAIAIVVCYEAAPKEEGFFIKNHYVDLILIDEDSITIENTRSNDTK